MLLVVVAAVTVIGQMAIVVSMATGVVITLSIMDKGVMVLIPNHSFNNVSATFHSRLRFFYQHMITNMDELKGKFHIIIKHVYSA